MARQASVRLTLENSQFLTEVKHAGDAVDKVAQKGNKGFQLFKGSADAAKKSITGLAGSLKNVLGMAATLGGAFSVANAVRGAVQLERTYRQIAFGVKDANGQMLQASDVQRTVERTAAAAAQSNGDMAQTFKDLLSATGDVDFVRGSMEAIGTTALATGESLADIGTVADQLHTKFGVTAKDMQNGLAQVLGAAKQGGPSFAEFADVIGSVGAEMLRAGLDGQRGLDFMLGSLVNTDDAAGGLGKQVKGLRALVQSLGDKGQLAKIGNAIGVDPKKLINEKDAVARLRMIFAKGGASGGKALLDTMNVGDERDTAQALFVKPFQKALDEAHGAGLKGKAAIDEALAAYDAHIRAFGKATMSGADVAQRAADERKSPEAQLTLALNKMNDAFRKPEIIQAINDIAQKLPAFAEAVGDVVSFITKNPVLSGALAVGANVGGSIGSSMLQNVIEAHILGGKKGGKTQADEVVRGLTSSGVGERLALPLREGLRVGGAGLRGDLATAFTTGAGALAAAGQAFGIAASAYLAYKIGTEQIDNAYGEETDAMKRLEKANMMRAPRTAAERDAQISELSAARKGAEGVGEGPLDNLFRGWARTASWATGNGFDSVPDSRDAAFAQRGEALQKIRALREQRFGTTSVEHLGGGTAPDGTKKTPVSLDSAAPRAIAEATKTALGGMVLTVRLASTSPGGYPSSGRGPMSVPDPRPGGGV